MDEQVKLALSIGVGITVQKTSAGYTATVDAVTATVAPPLVPAGDVPSRTTTTTPVVETPLVPTESPRVPSRTTTPVQVEDGANISPTAGTSTALLNPSTPMVAANISPTGAGTSTALLNPSAPMVPANISPTAGTSTALNPSTPMVAANVGVNLITSTAITTPPSFPPAVGNQVISSRVEDTANVNPTTGTSTALTPTTPMVPANVALNIITSTGFSTPPSFPPAVGNQAISSRENAESPRKKQKIEGTFTGTRGTGLAPTEASCSSVTTQGNEDTYMTDSSKNSPLKRKEPELTLRDVSDSRE